MQKRMNPAIVRQAAIVAIEARRRMTGWTAL
jgi:hypothetical protein